VIIEFLDYSFHEKQEVLGIDSMTRNFKGYDNVATYVPDVCGAPNVAFIYN
jgi:hypothetical protein